MKRLLACPFCRQLFGQEENVERCPECGLPLRPLEMLRPSPHGGDAEQSWVAPEDRRLPPTHFRRGRGTLLVIGVLGLAAFFVPWIIMRHPYDVTLSGFDLARSSAGWLWAGAVAWFVLIPLVWTRRTITELRGVRLICGLFSALTLVDVIMLWVVPSHSGMVPVVYAWAWGVYLNVVVSAAGIVVSTRLGGRLDDLPAVAWPDSDGGTEVESSSGETLH